MKGEGTLNAETCYKVVYYVVNRELASSKPVKGCEQMWQWATKIPKPEVCTNEIAAALCTSVSNSREIGLECFFQSMVTLAELRSICGKAFGVREKVRYEHLFSNTNNYSIKLGEFIRNFYNGFLARNEEDYRLLVNL